ncbi:transglycosylase SLT domain-containing protein [candidate division CSSED10-310 bacterium]|uniref:Transglycosylase SLT domain-containing protein n=1 Tax=candidate division CSSED10-310 bacterium TaxID=2855610 RepID=A0ABV6Z6H4_UNCC1
MKHNELRDRPDFRHRPVLYCLCLIAFLVCAVLSASTFTKADDSDSEKIYYELESLKQQISKLQQEIKPPYKMPKNLTLCGVFIDLEDPFIYRRVKKEINEIVFHEGQLGNLVDFSGEFFPIIEPIMAQHNVPDDLKYLVAVESNFKIRAASYAGAKGPWQFISSSAKQHGLKYTSQYDERYNLKLATEAAMKHLKQSYRLFGDWLLAITAYNKGDRGVNNILTIQGIDFGPLDEENNSAQSGNEKNNSFQVGEENLENTMAEQRDSNFWDLVLLVKIIRRGKVIGYRNEQERYVPRVIAMKLILENIYDYDFLKFDVENRLKPIQTASVIAHAAMSSVDVAKTLGISLWNLKHLNPQYKGVYPIFPSGKEFNLPVGMQESYAQKRDQIKKYVYKSYSRSSQQKRAPYTGGPLPASVILRSGETLWDIAQYYGVPMKTLLSLNGISYKSARYLRPGKTIKLK